MTPTPPAPRTRLQARAPIYLRLLREQPAAEALPPTPLMNLLRREARRWVRQSYPALRA